MAYTDVVRGLVEVIEGVPGIRHVVDYEPTSIGDTPTCYLLLDQAERISRGGMSGFTYTILARVCFAWMDNEQAEREVAAMVNPVAIAIEAGAGLNGELPHGIVVLNRVQAVFVSIGGVLYRALDFYIVATEKGGRREGQI